MSAAYEYSSDSDSDAAPEVVSLSSAKQGRRDDERRRREDQERCVSSLALFERCVASQNAAG